MSEGKGYISPAFIMWHWENLRKSKSGREDILELQESPVRNLFWLALDDGGLPSVMVQVEPDDKIPTELSGRNIHLRTKTIRLDGIARRVIELTCRDSALENPFSELVAGVHGRLSAGRNGKNALLGALSDFRALLEQHEGVPVSREQAVGLAGELLVLRELVAYSPNAWRAWEGALGGVWDFKAGSRALEVKSSTRPGEPTVIHQTLLPDASGAVSVGRLVRELMGLVDDATGFRERLASAGYQEDVAAGWDAHRFEHQGRSMFRVEGEFPRITQEHLADSRLAPGVDSVNYSIRLDVARSWQVASADESDRLREFVGAIS